MLRQALAFDLRRGEAEWLKDSRDLMVALAPYHDCARRLRLEVAATFREAADNGPQGLREVVTDSGSRDDVTPADFGYAIVEEPGGPSYRFS